MSARLTRNDIRIKAEAIVRSYLRETGYTLRPDLILDVMDMYETIIYPEYDFGLITNIDLGTVDGAKVLGKTVFKDRMILLDPSINRESKNPRYAFTFGHEIAHVVFDNDGTNPECLRCTDTSMNNADDIRETRANIFAQNLLMPYPLVKIRLNQYYGQSYFIYTGQGPYYLNKCQRYVSHMMDYCRQIASPLTRYFSNISIESLAYAIFTHGFIVNRTSEELHGTSIADDVNEYMASLLQTMRNIQ